MTMNSDAKMNALLKGTLEEGAEVLNDAVSSGMDALIEEYKRPYKAEEARLIRNVRLSLNKSFGLSLSGLELLKHYEGAFASTIDKGVHIGMIKAFFKYAGAVADLEEAYFEVDSQLEDSDKLDTKQVQAVFKDIGLSYDDWQEEVEGSMDAGYQVIVKAAKLLGCKAPAISARSYLSIKKAEREGLICMSYAMYLSEYKTFPDSWVYWEAAQA